MSVRAVRSDASSDEDADGLLQGRQPPRRVRTHHVRLSGVHLPTPTSHESAGETICQFPPGDKSQGRQTDSGQVPGLATSPDVPARGRRGPHHQPRGARMGAVLRPLLSVTVLGGAPPCQPRPRRMGPPEVQAVSSTSAGVAALAATSGGPGAAARRAVAARGEAVTVEETSRMRRESHVRFCERGGV